MPSEARGDVTIDVDECKGGLCVESCPPKCLVLAPELSQYGVHPVTYTGEGCMGCGACFYCCPEPGAITREITANFAGFGGQVVLLMGQLLAEMGLREQMEVSWLPS